MTKPLTPEQIQHLIHLIYAEREDLRSHGVEATDFAMKRVNELDAALTAMQLDRS